LTAVSHAQFVDTLLPAVRKAMLRNAESVIDGKRFAYH
jgi:hypothetical protein